MNATTRALNPGLIDEAKFPLPAARKNATNTGKAFQAEMETTAGGYQSRRVATFRKVDPPVRVIWIDDKANPGRKRQHVIFQANPFLDYVGCLASGRALMIEAKSTATHRLPFNGDSGLKRHQVANVKTWHAAGAVVALVWQWAGKVALFTPGMLVAAEARGDKSLVFEAGLAVPPGVGSVVWDFLPVIDGATPAERL